MNDIGHHLFWVTSRAAGVSAMVLASLSVGYGLSMAGRIGRSRISDRKVIHEALAIGVVISLAIHALSLLGDAYMHPSIADVTVPLAWSYKTLWTTVGIVGGWGLVLTGLSFYARKRIGVARWKVIHRFTLLAWIAGLIHAIGEGTDAGQTWFLALLALTTAPPLILLGIRVAERRPRTTKPRTASTPLPA